MMFTRLAAPSIHVLANDLMIRWKESRTCGNGEGDADKFEDDQGKDGKADEQKERENEMQEEDV